MLRHRDFRLLWIGETTSALGTSISRLAIPLIAVVTLQAGTFEIGLLTAAGWLPWLIVGLPAGAWVDRLPRRPLMLTCNTASLLLLLSVPLAAAADALTVGQLLAVAFLTGTASVFFQTAMQVYLPTVVDEPDLARANAALLGSESATQVAGPTVAGLIAQLIGAVAALIADAVSFLVSSACLLLIRDGEARPARPPRTTTLRREIKDGLHFVWMDPYLRVFTAYGAASNIFLTGYQAILIPFLIRAVGVNPGGVGLLISGMSIGGVIGASVSGWVSRRFGTGRAVLIGVLGAGPFSLLIPLATPGFGLVWVVLGGIGVGVGIVGGNVITGSFRQTYTPRPLLGRVVVSMHFLNYGTIPLGAVLAGTLGSVLGLRPAMWTLTVGMVLASLIMLSGPIRRHCDLPTSPAPDPSPARARQPRQQEPAIE